MGGENMPVRKTFHNWQVCMAAGALAFAGATGVHLFKTRKTHSAQSEQGRIQKTPPDMPEQSASSFDAQNFTVTLTKPFDLPLEELIFAQDSLKRDYSNQQALLENQSTGNGIFTKSGHFITCEHVLNRFDGTYSAITKDCFTVKLELVAYSQYCDLAILHVKDKEKWNEYARKREFKPLTLSKVIERLAIQTLPYDEMNKYVFAPFENFGKPDYAGWNYSYQLKNYDSEKASLTEATRHNPSLIKLDVSFPAGTSGSPAYDANGNISGLAASVSKEGENLYGNCIPAFIVAEFIKKCRSRE